MWIWGGCIIMALGGFLAASDRRYRMRARKHAAIDHSASGKTSSAENGTIAPIKPVKT
jgi:hypothetical protein